MQDLGQDEDQSFNRSIPPQQPIPDQLAVVLGVLYAAIHYLVLLAVEALVKML